MSKTLILLSVLGSAAAIKQGVVAPDAEGHRFKSTTNGIALGGTCSSLSNCDSCVSINFCMWSAKAKNCESEQRMANKNVYEYVQGSCDKKAGDWLELGGGVVEVAEGQQNAAAQQNADAVAMVRKSKHGGDDTYIYHPLMMQPPAIASQDEDHIFQGPFPRPDYGMGELGYKLQGVQINRAGADESNTPRKQCPGNPLGGCLEKPVIIPQGAVNYDKVDSRGEFYGHPNPSEERHRVSDKAGPTALMEAADPQSLASLVGFSKPKWQDQYDATNEI